MASDWSWRCREEVGGTISGDLRGFAQIATTSDQNPSARGTRMAEQGVGWRMRRDQGDDSGRTQGQL